MSVIINKTEQDLRRRIEESINKAIANGTLPQGEIGSFNIEVPADRANGDYSTNAAMASARVFRLPPRKIAEAIVESLDLSGSMFERCEIAGAGFINFYFSNDFYAEILLDLEEKGDNYGRSDYGQGKKVMVEFVSANPTGPMHMGNARGGALGDSLACVLDYAGYNVSREFYINDAGNQIDKFGLSLDVRYLQHFLGEDEVPLPRTATMARISERERSSSLRLMAIPTSTLTLQSAERHSSTLHSPRISQRCSPTLRSTILNTTYGSMRAASTTTVRLQKLLK